MVRRLLGATVASCALCLMTAATAHAYGPHVSGKCAPHDTHVVCVTARSGDEKVVAKAGPSEVRVDEFNAQFTPPYDYTFSGHTVIIDVGGVTINTDSYISDYYNTEETHNTKHIGTDGYHEHETYSDYGGYATFSSTDNSIDANGVDLRSSSWDDYSPPQQDRTYVDTSPTDGVGAGKTYDDGYGCYNRTTVGYDPAADPTAVNTFNGSGCDY